jgi:gamma-glutamyltranspeptidase/glutathione hydrolase
MTWLIFCLVLVIGCSSAQISTLYRHGALATDCPIATEIGSDIFARGGNAFDVAVAVGFALAVTYPEAGNLGGGGFALIRDSKTGEIRSLDFRETAPLAATETMYLNDSGEVIESSSTYGARASGIPGTVAGLYELWQRYGSMSWDELISPAAQLADTGLIIDSYLAHSLREHQSSLAGHEETAAIYLPNGQPPAPGERLEQKDLAGTLYEIASEGYRVFYRGIIADKITEAMRTHGGLITREDLAGYRPRWREPVRFTFDSLDIYSMAPPSSGGIVIGQILSLLEQFDLSTYTPDSPEYLHLFVEASRLAFADRAEHLGDPDFWDIPDSLLRNSYLDNRRKLIIPKHAGSSEQITAGTPRKNESNQTTHYSICDKDGNMVAVTTTLNSSYGSKLVVDGCGFLLNNEMDDFSIKPGYPNIYGLVGGDANKIEPGKRMLSSMSPTLVLLRDEPFLILGSPGGSKIISTVAQAIINCSRFDLSLEEIVRQPRVHHQWLPDQVFLEEGQFGVATIQALIRYGHNVKERSPFGDLQMVKIESGGMMQAVSDPRRNGSAGGY